MRIDAYLVRQGLCRSRATATEAIKNSKVMINGKLVGKPSVEVTEDDIIIVEEVKEKYVSRGGYKLEGALATFSIDVTNMHCADIGASTGGFTDCLLQHGAASVLDIDVGSNQLHEKIKTDVRVTSLENTNIRTYVPQQPNFADFVCADVSFISLKLTFPGIDRILSQNGTAVCLIKPQFEVGRENIGKSGIVKNTSLYADVIKSLQTSALENNLVMTNITFSPISGGDGNIEFLCRLCRSGNEVSDYQIANAVRQAVVTIRE